LLLQEREIAEKIALLFTSAEGLNKIKEQKITTWQLPGDNTDKFIKA